VEPNTIGELQGYKLREMRKESLRQWRIIHLNLKLWNIKHGRSWLSTFKAPSGYYDLEGGAELGRDCKE